MRNWKMKLRLVDGHRYFAELGDDGKPTGKIGVADDSGAHPGVTDDGVLYLDSDRHVCIDNWDGGSRIQALVPVVRPDGRKYHVMERPEGGFAVALAFDLEVNIRGSMVNVLHSFDQLVKSRPRSVHFPEHEGEGLYTMWKDGELSCPSQESKS